MQVQSWPILSAVKVYVVVRTIAHSMALHGLASIEQTFDLDGPVAIREDY